MLCIYIYILFQHVRGIVICECFFPIQVPILSLKRTYAYFFVLLIKLFILLTLFFCQIFIIYQVSCFVFFIKLGMFIYCTNIDSFLRICSSDLSANVIRSWNSVSKWKVCYDRRCKYSSKSHNYSKKNHPPPDAGAAPNVMPVLFQPSVEFVA